VWSLHFGGARLPKGPMIRLGKPPTLPINIVRPSRFADLSDEAWCSERANRGRLAKSEPWRTIDHGSDYAVRRRGDAFKRQRLRRTSRRALRHNKTRELRITNRFAKTVRHSGASPHQSRATLVTPALPPLSQKPQQFAVDRLHLLGRKSAVSG